ncbi:hypothetical protein SUGI_0024240 [Cryptomeria japonica]|nr:hypothetical protein SUGI_0024240 [Cryptomeria japonica]
MNKALPSTNVEGVTRRTANFHPNLWEDDFIQSLPNLPYDAPHYRERADGLVAEVKDMFNAVGAADSCAENIYKRLEMVDNVERFGIGRHFQKEIAEALDYVYRFWNESSKDLNTAALGLRVLRLHRYPVSSDVLEQFKEKDGQFIRSTSQTEEEIKSIVNLFRASLISFPEETIMDEAKAFSTMYLNQVLEKTDIISANLLQEIRFNLEYGWFSNLPGLEARHYMDIYGENCSWVKKVDNKKILGLAKLDFNINQSLHRSELQIVSRWWKESGLCKFDFMRHRHVEYFFAGCAITSEPKNSTFRIIFAKCVALTSLIDDLYDTHGTLDELKLFTKAIRRWDSSPPHYLPEYMKLAYRILYDAIIESAEQAKKIQGRDTLHLVQKAWVSYMDSVMEEAKWLSTGCIPTLKEYLENAKESVAFRTTTLEPILTLDGILPENILQKVDYPSTFNDLLCLTLRLRGDTRTFKAEADRGEVTSSISCYMKDHPNCNEEDALRHIISMLDKHLKELNKEYLKHDDVPICTKDTAFNILRCYHVFYRDGDGIGNSGKDTKNHVEKILIEPMEL